MTTPADKLRVLLARPGLLVMPCCFDALSARLIEGAGFPLTFMSGFAVSAARLGLPDTGLISYGEILDQGRNICAAVGIPVLGDADTGYGNAVNVKRTVRGYAQAGFACAMTFLRPPTCPPYDFGRRERASRRRVEDQLWPKRCGHTRGKQVVDRGQALARIKAAVDARDEAEMARVCTEVPAPAMANMVEGGDTPVPPPARLEELGYRIAAYPLTLLSAAIKAMEAALSEIAAGRHPDALLKDFAALREVVGFDDYYAVEERYKND